MLPLRSFRRTGQWTRLVGPNASSRQHKGSFDALGVQDPAPFLVAGRLYADQAVDLALAGEIDITGLELFATALSRVLPLSSPGSELVVDGRALEFINYRGLLAMDCHAAANDRHVTLRSNSSVLVDVAGLLCSR